MAKHRLDLLGKRLKRDPTLRQKYTEGIHDSLRKGYAEEVVHVNRADNCVWYLPHHPVIHPRKPDKVRIVFDCAARHQGTSLNDCIYRGPDLTNKLWEFYSSSVKSPFLSVLILRACFTKLKSHPWERDVLRFLWRQDDDPDKPPKHYCMTAHIFGGVWSPSAATFALQRVAEDNRDDFSDDAVETVQRNFYVDDCLKFVATEDAAIRLAADLRELLARGGFRLTNWLSNSKKAIRSIPTEEWAKSLRELNLDRDDLLPKLRQRQTYCPDHR